MRDTLNTVMDQTIGASFLRERGAVFAADRSLGPTGVCVGTDRLHFTHETCNSKLPSRYNDPVNKFASFPKHQKRTWITGRSRGGTFSQWKAHGHASR